MKYLCNFAILFVLNDKLDSCENENFIAFHFDQWEANRPVKSKIVPLSAINQHYSPGK